MKIIPETEKYKNIKNVKRISYCYLHGNLCIDAEFDIFGFIDFIVDIPKNGTSYIAPDIIDDGIYSCEFEGVPCTFFYWNSKGGAHGINRGLVVYNNDKISYEYAKKCYDNKELCI
jgi:hypothetical protein